jgi:hypothetical protein
VTDPESAAPLPCVTCGHTSPDSAWLASWPYCPACAAPQFTVNQTPERPPHHNTPPPVDPIGD